MNMKMSDLISLGKCEKKYQLDKLEIITEKGENYHLAIAMKETIKNLLSFEDEEFEIALRNNHSYYFLNNILDDDLFVPLAKKEKLKSLSEQIERYVIFLKKVGGKIISYDVTQDININGNLVTVSADLIIKYDSGIEIVKIKRRAPDLSYKARTPENMPKNNIELYLLQALGKHLYPNKNIIGSFHHMTCKKDKDEFILNYNLKKGYNIISYQFNPEEVKIIEERIDDLFKISKSKKFIKTDDLANCRTCPYTNICNYKKAQNISLKKIEEIIKAPKDFTLTKSQRKAVLLDDGFARINAGAGSGKTTVVALRVVELILAGCKSEDILLITFTNKGANEMREKIAYWLNQEGIEIEQDKFNITTFNAWGDKIIQENYKSFGFTQPPKLIEKVDKYDILFEILERNRKLEGYDYKNPLMNFRYAKGVVVKLEDIFNYIKAFNATTPEKLANKIDIKEAGIFLKLYDEYNNLLKEENYIEYQDQINLIINATENNQDILSKYNYKHIIVDEFQDSAEAELDLIFFLSNQSKFKSLMVVGDDSQSIFGFRNTSQENILNFHLYFNNMQDINMVENFRSTPEIIELANELNDLNSKKIEKKLVSGLKSGDIPELRAFNSSADEYSYISNKIKELLIDNKPEDIAIIARTKYELFSIEEYLKDLNIPYIIDIPEPLLNNTNIHIAKSLLTFLDDLKTTQGLFEYLYVITNEFDRMNEDEIKEIVENKADEISKAIELSNVDANENEIKLNYFFSMLEEINDDDFKKFLLNLKERNYEFGELKDYLYKFIEYEDNKTIEKNSDKYSAVTLTTAHTSKGKEFKIVFATISKFTAEHNTKERDEERRTLFVSITRAKEKLFITHQYCSNHLKNKYTNPFALELETTKKCKVIE